MQGFMDIYILLAARGPRAAGACLLNALLLAAESLLNRC
jgi:hypothetical protein